jgi:hypothetical protein
MPLTRFIVSINDAPDNSAPRDLARLTKIGFQLQRATSLILSLLRFGIQSALNGPRSVQYAAAGANR